MGRPLNKKYFGNRNIGSTGTTDNGIGGEGVASAAVSGGAYTVRPTVTFTAPQLPNGVTATATITSQVNVITVIGGSGGSNYTSGDTLTIGNGTIFTVGTVNGGGAIQTVTITERGSYPYASGALPTGAQAITNITVTNPLASGATFTVNYNAKETVITEKGSGYTSAPTAASGPTQSVSLGVVTLTTDSGAVGSTTNQENAITMTAYLTGGSATVVDIIRQVSTNRYKVTDGTRTGIVKLVAKATGNLLAGEANIIAVDNAGTPGTYYVTKLTAHKATLTRGTGTVYANGAATQWTFGAATATVAKIPNA